MKSSAKPETGSEAGSGSIEADQVFIKRYRYMPDERLIEDGRVLFARTDFSSWVKLPDAISSNLDIRYLKGPGTIPVYSVTSAAIPRKGKSAKEAIRFVQWLDNGRDPVKVDRTMGTGRTARVRLSRGVVHESAGERNHTVSIIFRAWRG